MKDIICFLKDTILLDVISKYSIQNNITNYPYDAILENINFDDKLVIVDIDNETLNLKSFLSDLAVFSKGTILVLSANCDRKNISTCARNGADRFIVKPINKKRFKKYIEPYLFVETNALQDLE